MSDHSAVTGGVERYYSARLAEHGPSPAGVDWNSAESQRLRFRELLRVCGAEACGSLLDYGCGYGALAAFLDERGHACDYVGFDLSESMVAKARTLNPDRRFTTDPDSLAPASWVIASGVFNVRAGASTDVWRSYVCDTLDRLDELALSGFAFNMLTSYSDADLMRDDLHYADPLEIFDRCKRRYSRHIALLHDYGLYEFTVLVRRTPEVVE